MKRIIMVAKRDKNIEYIRAIACVGVVIFHTFKGAHAVYPDMSDQVRFLCIAIVNNLRWCVPVFLMITGYLLLDPEKNITLSKIGRYICRAAVVLAVFGTGFALMELVFNQKTVTLLMLPQAAMNMLTGKTWDHMWYLYTLIVLYCFLPLMRAAVCALKTPMLIFSCAVMAAVTSVLPTLEAFGLKLGFPTDMVSVYILYMLLGYMLKNRLIKISTKFAAAGLIISTLFLGDMAFLSELTENTVDKILISHASAAVLIQSVCIFSLMIHIKESENKRMDRAVLSFANASFGVYILHPFFINLFYKALGFSPEKYGVAVMLLVLVLTLMLTYVTVVLIKKISVVRKFL